MSKIAGAARPVIDAPPAAAGARLLSVLCESAHDSASKRAAPPAPTARPGPILPLKLRCEKHDEQTALKGEVCNIDKLTTGLNYPFDPHSPAARWGRKTVRHFSYAAAVR